MKPFALLAVVAVAFGLTLPLNPGAWNVYHYGYLKPFHPIALPNGGWEFAFPIGSNPPLYGCPYWTPCDNFLGYVNTAFHYPSGHKKGVPLTGTIYMTAQTAVTGNPIYYSQSSSDNDGDYPSHARPYIDTGGNGEFDRWFASNGDPAFAFQLDQGLGNVAIPIDPHNWISVYGRAGDEDSTTLAGFNKAFGNIKLIGFVMGGGYFYGHAVNVLHDSGTSRFQLLGYSVQ